MRVLIGVGVVAAIIAAGLWVVILLRGSSSAAGGGTNCSVPAVPGAPVTVAVEGPQTEGPGAAGTAEANASPAPSSSVVQTGDVSVTAVQLQHASTINAVGLQRTMTERARVIAIATAWQETTLRNLTGGDRDSVGLFQQRPSQGWGEPAQLLDPVFASDAFYDALLKVDGWQQLSLTAAAQAVQYSGFPDAYARWEPDATTLVRALSGADPVLLTCPADALVPDPIAAVREVPAEATAAAPALRTLLATLVAEVGAPASISVTDDGTSALVGTGSDQLARVVAAWSVAHATGGGLADVTVGGRSYSGNAWRDAADGALPTGQVRLTVAPAAP